MKELVALGHEIARRRNKGGTDRRSSRPDHDWRVTLNAPFLSASHACESLIAHRRLTDLPTSHCTCPVQNTKHHFLFKCRVTTWHNRDCVGSDWEEYLTAIFEAFNVTRRSGCYVFSIFFFKRNIIELSGPFVRIILTRMLVLHCRHIRISHASLAMVHCLSKERTFSNSPVAPTSNFQPAAV